jgi:protein involved in polysaccharide export with SLBB domain
LTKKALLENCEIARYKVEGDERVREVFNINLKEAMRKNFKIYPDDEIKIFAISNWKKKMYITLKGEVRHPGRYAITVGEKLASVIKRAGGFSENAFVEGAVFTRESVKKMQEKQIKESLSKLKNRALALQSKGSSVGEDENAKEKMLLSIKELEKKANEIKPIGRISINLYLDLDRFENSPYNITLKDGDSLTVPAMIDTVSVIGQVLNQNTFIYDPKLSVEDYIEKAGGLNQSADDDHIYVVKANGEAYRYKRNFFSANKEIFKGDTIVVPLKLDAISNLKFTKDVSDILYKLAVTAASLKTVGAL